MTDDESGGWVSLFSGGKDSSWALYRALEAGLSVSRLLTVHPSAESYLYHVPATRLAGLAAESIGLPLVEIETGDLGADSPGVAADAGRQGDRELETLEATLREMNAETPIEGVIAGAIESEFQTARIEGMCDRLGLELFAPLWREEPHDLAAAMCDAGFDIRVLQVAARGLDESWLGRTLDREAFEDLEALNEAYGVHILGEGGEFETLVTDGPHMSRPIELEYETEWNRTRGRLRVTDAWLDRESGA
ncbi:ATP-binding protein [Halobacteriales archaeon QS_3_64_16]|nr:MAG: ATP-binding protein [Halobacteriales archaeon QS_3_64_16]